MYMILSDEIRALLDDVRPWIIGTEGADKDFEPKFKSNTPEEIIQKHKRLKELCREMVL